MDFNMIWISTNEKRAVSRITELRKMGLQFSWDNLPVGDLKIDETIVEVKEFNDYLKSLTSKHLNNQLVEMSHNCELSYLIIIGNPSEGLYNSNISRESFYSSIIGCSFQQASSGKQGIIITVNVENDYDFALCIKYLEKKSAKGTPRLPQMQKIKWGYSDQAYHLLACIPGIGQTRARDILEHFKSVKNVACASTDELQQVNGIGRQLAGDIYLNFNLEV